MLDKIKPRLTEDARYWYKMWSSWLALAWGGIVYFFVEEPSSLQQALSVIPEPYRHHCGGPVATFAALLPIIVRCLKQGGLQRNRGFEHDDRHDDHPC